MSIGRKSLLQKHLNAVSVANNQDAPDNLRSLAKRAADQSGALLGLQDALARKQQQEAAGAGIPVDPTSLPQA